MNKEQIYDEQIYPLMAEIVAICQLHKIAMLASFAIPTDDDPTLQCTTTLLSNDYDPPEDMKKAADKLFQKDFFLAAIVVRDKGGPNA